MDIIIGRNGPMDEQITASNKSQDQDKLYKWWLFNVSRGALSLVQVPHHFNEAVEKDMISNFIDGTLSPLGTVRLLEFYMLQIKFGNRNDVPDELKELHQKILDNEEILFDIPSGFNDRYLVIDKLGLE